MQNSRKKILEVALTAFIKHGYNGVSMNEIVTASGMSKGAIYHYFRSKDDLYEQTVNDYLTRLYHLGFRDFFCQQFPSIEVFLASYRNYLVKLIKHEKSREEIINLLFFITEATQRLESVKVLRQESEKQILSAIINQLNRFIPKDQTIEVAQVIMDLVEGVMISYTSGIIDLTTADQILKQHFAFITK